MRAIKVKPHPNPTGLSVADRELCIDFLRSLKTSIDRELDRYRRQRRMPGWKELPMHIELEARERVYRAAMNQLVGRQKNPGKLFALEREVPIDDMAYVRQSLGFEQG